MKNQKQRGITLMALVITIIILLILAGITINLTIGKNGIITKAKQAGKNYLEAQAQEENALKELYNEMETQIGGGGGTSGDISNDAITKLKEFKEKIAKAITDKGVATSKEDTADTMASNIRKIETGNGITAPYLFKKGMFNYDYLHWIEMVTGKINYNPYYYIDDEGNLVMCPASTVTSSSNRNTSWTSDTKINLQGIQKIKFHIVSTTRSNFNTSYSYEGLEFGVTEVKPTEAEYVPNVAFTKKVEFGGWGIHEPLNLTDYVVELDVSDIDSGYIVMRALGNYHGDFETRIDWIMFE